MTDNITTALSELKNNIHNYFTDNEICEFLFDTDSTKILKHVNIHWIIDAKDIASTDTVEFIIRWVIANILSEYQLPLFNKPKINECTIEYSNQIIANEFIPINYKIDDNVRLADIENYMNNISLDHFGDDKYYLHWSFPIYEIDKKLIQTFE